jgi:hypothetical protein
MPKLEFFNSRKGILIRNSLKSHIRSRINNTEINHTQQHTAATNLTFSGFGGWLCSPRNLIICPVRVLENYNGNVKFLVNNNEFRIIIFKKYTYNPLGRSNRFDGARCR